MTTATVPGKIILFGEHAVVYGRPAIAVPVRGVSARVEVSEIRGATPGEIFISAPEIHLHQWLHHVPAEHPLANIIGLTLAELKIKRHPALHIRINSTIPISAGLGSGAAVSVGIARCLSDYLGKPLSRDRQSALALETEKIHHGTPSGIDTTVVTYEEPLYFVKGKDPERIRIAAPLTLAIGDSGIATPTANAVAMVRKAWERDRVQFEALFDSIEQTVDRAREMLESGTGHDLGPLMDHNHALLERIGVSSAVIRQLVQAAKSAGARGAKLSGAGLGGNVVALTDADHIEQVVIAMLRSGAVWTHRFELGT
jgi:mevalonate kinase